MIDCHTHIGRNENISGSVTQLLKSMDEAGIEKSLVFANKIGDASNEYMLEQIAPHKDRLYGVAAVHPTHPKRSEYNNKEWIQYHTSVGDSITRWYQENKIVAVKFYTGYDHYYPSDFEARVYLNVLNKIGCAAIFHSGDCHSSCSKKAKLKYAHPLHIDDVAVDYPGINFVIAHMGFPWVRDAAQVCYKNSNVYADISGFVYGEFTPQDVEKFGKCLDEFCDIAPWEKLLFGTDWPISNQKSYVTSIWGKDDVQQLYSVDKRERMDATAKKVFKL